ncbi:hypothetical protein BBP40_004846 [Aspergillus hancockii]|nr:hypothetical protein BBP40_004846 [Aspergillus hancockii]
MTVTSTSATAQPTVLDIRRTKVEDSVPAQVLNGLTSQPKTLPALLFYSMEGIQHWNHHSHEPEFYPRQEEIRILEKRAHEMASTIAENSIVVDLGSACLDKVTFLLEALEAQQKAVTYYSLDLSAEEVASALQALPTHQFQYVQFAGLHGTFEDGLHWLKETPEIRDLPHHILLFGLTIGNFSRANAITFLSDIADNALSGMPEKSSLIVSIDSCKMPTKVLRAYTCEGVVPFALAGLKHGNNLLKQKNDKSNSTNGPVFNIEEWYFMSEWNHRLGRHEASLIPRSKDIRLGPPLDEICIAKDEKVRFGCSYKYDLEERQELFRAAGLENMATWGESDCDVAFYGLKLGSVK